MGVEQGSLFLYVLPLLINAILGILLAVFIMYRRLSKSAWALLLLVLGATIWSLGYALEFIFPEIEIKLIWAKFQYIGITSVPLGWYLFSVQHLGSTAYAQKVTRYRFFLYIIPILTNILVWTNESHGMVWTQVELHTHPTIQVLAVEHGVWFWLNWVYSHVLVLLGTVTLITGLLGSVRYHRWQIVLMLLAAILPWLGNLIYVSHLDPIAHLDLTPFAFIIAGFLLTISLFRYHLIDIQPIAQRAVFYGLTDPVLVLDMQDCIVDLNDAAREMTGEAKKGVLGKPLSQALTPLAPWFAQAGFTQDFQVEISLGEETKRRFYDLHITPLSGPRSQPIGRLAELHDITPLKEEQTRLEQARLQLEEMVGERTETLQKTVEKLQVELNQRSLAEKRFEKVVEMAPDAMILLDNQARIILINAQAEELFGYRREELLGEAINKLIPLNRREGDLRVLQQYISHPTTREVSFGMDLLGLRKDGSQFPAEISLGPLHTEGGFWVACNIRDISQRVKTEQAQQRLLDEIKQSQAQLRTLTVRLQLVQEFERRQIARELHDRVGQNLTGLNLNLQLIGNQLSPDSHAQILNRLSDSRRLVEETTRQVRDVMADLHPLALDEQGLVAALGWYGDNFSQRTGIKTRLEGKPFEPRLPSHVEMVLFRLVQEALNNVAKHAHATRVTIAVDTTPETVNITVSDNGQGFETKELNPPEGQPHYGLVNMRQRVASIGGELVIDSTPGQGARVSIRVWRQNGED